MEEIKKFYFFTHQQSLYSRNTNISLHTCNYWSCQGSLTDPSLGQYMAQDSPLVVEWHWAIFLFQTFRPKVAGEY